MRGISQTLQYLFAVALFNQVLSIQLWSSPGALPTTIPAGCRSALSQNITCSQLVTPSFISAGRSLSINASKLFCTDACYTSLQAYKTNVDSRCGSTLYRMYANSTFNQSGMAVADPLSWAYNVTCIQDSTGFCLPALYNGTKPKCSDCSLKYGQAMLSSDYGRVRVKPDAYSSLLANCSTPASKYPYTYTSTTSSPTITPTGAPAQNCTGTRYTVGASDTCNSIASKNSIATDRFITQNGLDYNCSSIKAGSTVCIGQSCSLRMIKASDTCDIIISGQKFTSVQLISWNPTIHTGCDNLDSMVGRNICVSPPGTNGYNASTATTASQNFTSMFPGPFTTGGSVNSNPPNMTTTWINSQTSFAIPTYTQSYNLTRASLIYARQTYCPITPDDYRMGITVYDLPDACIDLLQPYCSPNPDLPMPTSTTFPAVCTPDRSIVTPTPATVPSPLEPGTISSCKQYYQVLDGDTCSSVAKHYGITTAQFNAWNPGVGTDCSKLYLGYVCLPLLSRLTAPIYELRRVYHSEEPLTDLNLTCSTYAFQHKPETSS
ncbi:hypothetical protein VTL71DRAFT_9241 [Oculimacula yallundae]|uniref:LysM domain-containing protein n=1 Tax=Oculimacula yallundae TaxID=86028 RepID=A0ABR4BSM2_9HELO